MSKHKKGGKRKKHVSEKQRLANQANAQQSTGPTSTAGKAASSQYRLTHGGYSKKKTLMPWESQDDFDAFYEEMWHEINPRNAFQRMQADDIIWAEWKKDRPDRFMAMLAQEEKDPKVLIPALESMEKVSARLIGIRNRAIKKFEDYASYIPPKRLETLYQQTTQPPKEDPKSKREDPFGMAGLTHAEYMARMEKYYEEHPDQFADDPFENDGLDADLEA